MWPIDGIAMRNDPSPKVVDGGMSQNHQASKSFLLSSQKADLSIMAKEKMLFTIRSRIRSERNREFV
jgi:hypothetical protein